MKKIIIPMMIIMSSCSVQRTFTSTIRCTGDIVWMNDSGDEVMRWENSVIDSTVLQTYDFYDGSRTSKVIKNSLDRNDGEFVKFTSGGKTMMISGGMILISNIRSESTEMNMHKQSIYKEIDDFVYEQTGIRYVDTSYDYALIDIYVLAGKKLNIVEFIKEFEKRFDIVTRYRHVPQMTSTIYDLYDIVIWCKLFPETETYEK